MFSICPIFSCTLKYPLEFNYTHLISQQVEAQEHLYKENELHQNLTELRDEKVSQEYRWG